VRAHFSSSFCCRPEAGQNVGWNVAYIDVEKAGANQLSGAGRENKGRHISKLNIE
jgi:hypothetical protein